MHVDYAIPREGADIWFDIVAIPADAPHPDNAQAFLNYLMDPKVIAGVSNEIGYANGNAASLPFVNADLKNDPLVYPPGELRKRLFTAIAHSPEFSREQNRAWTRVKTGQ